MCIRSRYVPEQYIRELFVYIGSYARGEFEPAQYVTNFGSKPQDCKGLET